MSPAVPWDMSGETRGARSLRHWPPPGLRLPHPRVGFNECGVQVGAGGSRGRSPCWEGLAGTCSEDPDASSESPCSPARRPRVSQLRPSGALPLQCHSPSRLCLPFWADFVSRADRSRVSPLVWTLTRLYAGLPSPACCSHPRGVIAGKSFDHMYVH